MDTFHRGRRLRRSDAVRRLVRETAVSVDHLVYPLFVVPGTGVHEPIASMPGQARRSVDLLVEECRAAVDLGIPAVLLFGIPEGKDAVGSGASATCGIVQQACDALKRALPDLCIITDVCLCEYTDHGHCGILSPCGEVHNDLTLGRLCEVAVSHARAGADIIAPSDMMDGRIGAIRGALDEADFSLTPIMSYAAKYASAFYGPFRDAAGSTPRFGDRRAYQMDPANRHEALREIEADLAEGADIIMVKPALAYLDIIREAHDRFDIPLAAYNVSGEYSMVKAAAAQGWLDERRTVLESLTGMCRAGADILITYHAPDVARWLDGAGARAAH
jgi:porphobilinogen synthase